MKIAVSADHAGYLLRREIVKVLQKDGHEVLDFGTDSADPVDYPDSARDVAVAVQKGEAERGIVVCGSGAGVSVTANKFRGIRAACAHDTYTAHQCVEHDAVNVLCLGSRVVGGAVAAELVRAFIGAEFSGAERYRRRLAKIEQYEREQLGQ